MSEYVYCSDGTPLASAGGEISLPRERVVRCRDCKQFERRGEDGVCNRFIWAQVYAKPDGFCAWAERREQ